MAPDRGAAPAQSRGFAGRDVLCLSSIDWDFLWQGHQEIMSALAAAGHRVLYVENTGSRAVRPQDLPRIRERIVNRLRSTRGFRQGAPNLFVFSPLVLPFPHSRLVRPVNRFLLVRALRRWMRAARFEQPVLWTFLPTTLVVDVIDRLDPVLVVYYCMADWEKLSGAARITRSERALLRRTDVVFVQADALRRRVAGHANVHTMPMGVDMTLFDGSRRLEPPELAGAARPIMGYVGGLHRHVDFELLERVAREVPGTLVCVGPEQTTPGALAGLPSVRLVGPQPHDRLPDFLAAFDAGLIPYRLTDETAAVYPQKLAEYLAAGLPVVSTRLPEVQRFNEANGGVVGIAADDDDFVERARRAGAERDPEERTRRRAVAGTHAWDVRIGQMSRAVDDVLHERSRTGETWDARIARAYRRARLRVAGIVALVAIAWLAAFQTPAPWVVAAPLRLEAAPERADAAVVFGGGVGEGGEAGGGYEERVARAVELYRAGHVETIVFSSGYVFELQEAETMRTLAVSLGVDEQDVVLERRAVNTYENVRFTGAIAGARGWNRVLVVSSPYHMRRATMTWASNVAGIEAVPVPVRFSKFYERGRGASLRQLRAIVHEYAAIAMYWWRGWI